MRRENNKIEEDRIQEWGGGGERLKLWGRREFKNEEGNYKIVGEEGIIIKLWKRREIKMKRERGK